MNEFRDAIVHAAQRHTAYRNQAESIAAEVLAMPEMQAIKRIFAIGGEDWMRGTRVPESVIAWVLEGDDDE